MSNSQSAKLSIRRKNERQLRYEYFQQVFVEYCALASGQRAAIKKNLPAAVARLVTQLEDSGDLLEGDAERLDWNDIAVLEGQILAQLNEPSLRRAAWSLRSRFARLAGPEAFQEYQASVPPNANDPNTRIDDLRADLFHVLGLFQWIYGMTLVRENIRRRILKKLFWAAAVVAVVGLGIAMSTLDWNRPLVGTIALVLLFGTLGAYVSAQRRLQTNNDRADPAIGALGLTEFLTSAWFSLVSGGVFAVVLWLILVARYLDGTLFPTWAKSSFLPTDAENWAKLLVWSFIAGFAERLVPDTLDRLVNRAMSTPLAAASASAPATSPAVPPQIGGQPFPGNVQAMLDEFGAPKTPSSATDANRGQFGGKTEDQGWRLSAKLARLDGSPGVVSVNLLVERAGPGGANLNKAKFVLSSDFTKKPQVEVDADDQAFLLPFCTFFPFVVGVELLPSGPELEIDLAHHWPA